MPTKRERLHAPTHRERLHEPKAPIKRERLPEPKPYGRAARRIQQLTEARIAALRVEAKDYHVWDHGNDAQRGLAVIVYPSGVKTFTAYYNFKKQLSRSMALGRVGEMSLEAARKRTGEVRALAKAGKDPRKDDPTRSDTFEALVAEWHEKELVGTKQNKSADAQKSLVKYHCEDVFWHRPAATIRRQEIKDLLRGKTRPTAALLHALLAFLFKWAVDEEKLAASPMMGMKPPPKAESRKDKVKRGELQWLVAPRSDEVLRDLWALANELGGDDERFIKLLILTGKRRNVVQQIKRGNVVQSMRWEHIDRETWLWTPPPGSPKKRNNPVTLPALARRVLGPHGGKGDVVRVKEATVTSLQAVVRKRLELPDFFWHGVRHITVSGLKRLKVPGGIARLAMDHAKPKDEDDVHSDYEHVDFTAEVADALELWAGHIEMLVSPGEGVRLLR